LMIALFAVLGAVLYLQRRGSSKSQPVEPFEQTAATN